MSLLVKLGLDSGSLDKGLAGAQKNSQAAAKNITASMDKAGNALTVGLTLPIVAFGIASIKAASDSESALADLNATLKSTGGVAGVTAKDVTDFASSMQRSTKFEDDAIVSGQAMLLTFTKVGKEVFPDASTAMLNMAEKMKMDLPQAAMTLGKALNDPVAGVNALRRQGVKLSDQQLDSVKAFVAVGDIASAQKIILKELEVEFGGLAVAAGATSEGAMADLTHAIGELSEAVGKQLLPVLIPATKKITDMIYALSEMPAPVMGVIVAFLGLLAAIGPLLKFLVMIITISTALSAGGSLAGVGTAMSTLAPVVAGAISAMLIPLAVMIATLYLFGLAFQTNFGGIADTTKMLGKLFTDAWGDGGILGVLKLVSTFIKESFTMQLNNLLNLLKGIGGYISNYLVWGWTNMVTVIGWVIQRIQELVKAFQALEIPDWFTPGSPTPLELGIRGIGDAMKSTSGMAMPAFTAGLQMTPVTASANVSARAGTVGATSTVINLQFGDAVTMTQVRDFVNVNSEQVANAIVSMLTR